MSTEKIIDSLFDNNLEQFRKQVHAALFVKTGEYMNSAKQVVANSMFGNPEEVQEELKGNQSKLDAAPPFGKLTGADFKKLRSRKKMNEGYVYPEGEVDDDCFGKCHQNTVHGTTGGDQYHAAWTNCYNKCKKKDNQ
jgi:hypothetical protein